MGKIFRPSHRESTILSKIESSKEHARRQAISQTRDRVDELSNAISMKLIETSLIETTNKNQLQEQIAKCLETLCVADDFDIDYMVAPFRNLVSQPNVVTLYVTAYVIEKLINHKIVVDIFGSDEDIYACIHNQVSKILP